MSTDTIIVIPRIVRATIGPSRTEQLAALCHAKGLTPDEAISALVDTALGLMAHMPITQEGTLADDLGIARASRIGLLKRIEEQISEAELATSCGRQMAGNRYPHPPPPMLELPVCWRARLDWWQVSIARPLHWASGYTEALRNTATA